MSIITKKAAVIRSNTSNENYVNNSASFYDVDNYSLHEELASYDKIIIEHHNNDTGEMKLSYPIDTKTFLNRLKKFSGDNYEGSYFRY